VFLTLLAVAAGAAAGNSDAASRLRRRLFPERAGV
jgi:hypothetical protein